MTAENQRANVRIAAEALAPVAREHQLVITHGNGPQVGLLALQGAAYKPGEDLSARRARRRDRGHDRLHDRAGARQPAAVRGAVRHAADHGRGRSATIPAFENPTKFVGPVYDEGRGRPARRRRRAGSFKPDGDKWRRVVASPLPKRIFELRPIKWLLEHGTIVIAAGGGGIPTDVRAGRHRKLVGVECVIDKDLALRTAGARARTPTSSSC